MKYSTLLLILVIFALSENTCLAQKQDSLSYNFGVLRQKDDISFLEGETEKSIYESLKYSSLFKEGYISFGGSSRSQFEYFDNQGFIENNSDGWLLNRFTVHSKIQVNSDLYVFGELLAAFINSKEFPSPVDRDELTLSQLFLEYDKNNLTLTVGRVNPYLGSNRIISLREGPNTRRYFDGIRGGYSSKRFTVKGFYYQPVAIKPYAFDNNSLDGDEYLYGYFSSISSKSKSHNIDHYYIARYIETFRYSVGNGSEDRHSFGLRYYGNIEKFNFDLEGLYQFGKFNDLDIDAWTLSLKANYIIPLGTQEAINFGLKTEFISGDKDPNDNTLNTFNALYPRGAYFGRVAQFGPMNLFDIHPSVRYTNKNWFFMCDYVAFWRASEEDAVYGAGLNLSFPDTNQQKFIGHQYGGVIGYTLNSFISLEIEANYITAGNFLKESNLNNNLFHLVSTVEFKF